MHITVQEPPSSLTDSPPPKQQSPFPASSTDIRSLSIPNKTPLEVLDALMEQAAAQPIDAFAREWRLSADSLARAQDNACHMLRSMAADIAGPSAQCQQPTTPTCSTIERSPTVSSHAPIIGSQPEEPLVRPAPLITPAPTQPVAAKRSTFSQPRKMLLLVLAGNVAALCCFLLQPPSASIALVWVDEGKFWQAAGIITPTSAQQTSYARTLEELSNNKHAIIRDERGLTLGDELFSSFQDATYEAIELWNRRQGSNQP